MTAQTIARHTALVIEQYEAVQELGYLATTCELMACSWGITLWERQGLERRAAKYRALQYEALEQLNNLTETRQP